MRPLATVAVPETTVDEYGNPELWHNNVRPAGKIANVQAVAETRAVQCPSYRQFGLRAF
jgi:hypothetical protein